MLKPISFFIVITSVIGGSQMFVEPSLMTEFGGPNYSSATIVYYLWEKAFGSGYQLGYACAVAWLLAIIIFAVTAIQFRFGPKSDNYLE
jgi:multiple sugar transport system permease protein